MMLTTPALGGSTKGGLASPVHWSVSRNRFVETWNCSKEHSVPPKLSPTTVSGGWWAYANASACPPVRGGAGEDSYSTTSETLEASEPLALNASDHGVRVGWSLALSASTRATYGTTVGGCPFNVTTYKIVNASTTFTYTFAYQWCDVEAVVSATATAEVQDLTTGKTFPASNVWKGVHLASGAQTITYGYFGSYSNRSYWSQNYSYWVPDNYTFGGSSSLAGTFVPSFWVNGSFNASHAYALVVELDASIASESFRYHGGHAYADYLALGGTRHQDIGPVTIY